MMNRPLSPPLPRSEIEILPIGVEIMVYWNTQDYEDPEGVLFRTESRTNPNSDRLPIMRIQDKRRATLDLTLVGTSMPNVMVRRVLTTAAVPPAAKPSQLPGTRPLPAQPPAKPTGTQPPPPLAPTVVLPTQPTSSLAPAPSIPNDEETTQVTALLLDAQLTAITTRIQTLLHAWATEDDRERPSTFLDHIQIARRALQQSHDLIAQGDQGFAHITIEEAMRATVRAAADLTTDPTAPTTT